MGIYKLNVDGTTNGENSTGGCLIRNWEEELLVASAHKYGPFSVLYAELRALLEGLKLCHKYCISNVTVETDCLKVIQLLKTPNRPWLLRALIPSILKLSMLCNGKIVHVFRQQNKQHTFFLDWMLEV